MLEQINKNWNTGELEHPFGRGLNFKIETTEIYELEKRLKNNSVKIYKPIFENDYKVDDTTYTEIQLFVQDSDGYLLRFSQTKKQTTK